MENRRENGGGGPGRRVIEPGLLGIRELQLRAQAVDTPEPF